MVILSTDPAEIEVGVVGIGLMGSSIIVSLLASGHNVKAIAPIPADMENAWDRIAEQLQRCSRSGLLTEDVSACLQRLAINEDYNSLKNCRLVLECVIEDIQIKSQVYRRIINVVSEDAVIASNTSAISIGILQKLVSNPGRFLGIHWAEPAYATRFMEITCGEQTDSVFAEWVFNLAHHWAKEPTLLRKDIRGFITNRLMYAVYREIFNLTDSGVTTIDNADKAFRYDVGSWITLMGLFRRLDYSGLDDYAQIFKTIFPKLSNTPAVPEVMQRIVDADGRGIKNLHGLYKYTGKEAEEWETAFAAFNKDIFHLANLYPDPIPKKDKVIA